MKRLLFISTLLAVCAFGEEVKIRDAVAERLPTVTLEMRIVTTGAQANNGLRITAQGATTEGGYGLVVNIPGGKFNKRERFPVFLEPTPTGREVLDHLLTKTLGNGSPQTLFKPRGYSGSMDKTPKNFGQKGGKLFLGDPGIDGGLNLNITLILDRSKQSLSLIVCEESY